MDSYSVQAVLSVADKGFSDKMRGAVNSLEDLDGASQKTSSSIMDIAKGVGAFKAVSIAADALKASLGSAIDRFDTLNQYPKVMQNLGYTTDDANTSLSRLSDGITGLPTALDDAATYTKQWALATGDLDKATGLYLAINDGAIAYGASAEQAASCQEQLNQMISTGSYDLQSWKIINQNCPGLLDAVAQSMLGESAAAEDLRSALNDGTITTDQFESTLISLDQNGSESITAFSVAAKSATGGISTSVANMKTAVVRGMENVIRSTNDALENNGLPGFQEMMENATAGINTSFRVASGGIEILVSNLDILVPTLGTATAGFVAYKAAMDISDKYVAVKKAAAEAADQLTAVKSATDLAATAASAQESAVLSAEIAERKMIAARNADKEAIWAQNAAKKLATKASKLQADADSAAEKAERLKAKATKDQEAADRAAKRVLESRTKSTKLQERAEIAAATAEEARIAATEAETAATKLQTKADTLNATAAKAQAEADSKASFASVAKADAEKAETIATTASTHAEEANVAAETAGANAAKISNVAIATKTALLGVLSGKYTIVEAGQLAWNAAMAANPIGTVITATAILATVMVGVSAALIKLTSDHDSLWTTMRKTKKSTDELINSLEESKSAYKESMKETEDTTDAVAELADETIALANKTNRSVDETKTLKANVASLNSAIDGLNLAYDEETGLLNMSTEALQNKAKAYKAQEEGTKQLDRLNETLIKQQTISRNLEAAKKSLSDAEKSYYEELEQTGQVSVATSAFYAQQQKAVEDLEAQKKSLEAEELSLTSTVAACQEEQAAAVAESQAQQQSALAESIANQTVQLEDLSEANQDTVNSLKSTWQDYVDQATDMFDTLSDEQTVSVEEMIANIQKNQEIISQWGDNMEALRDRFANLGLSQGVLDDLADMGPEGAGYVAALVNASDEQLQVLAQSFDNGGIVAKESLLESLGVDSNEIPEAIQDMFTQVESSMRDTIESTDWASLGESMMTGEAAGITSNSELVSDAAATATGDARTAAGAAVGEGSPATAFIELGNNMVAGLALGLGDSGSATEAAVQMADNIIQEIQSAFNSADFSSVGNSAFSGIAESAVSNMDKVSAAINSGMSDSNSAVESGMSKMQNSTKSGMSQMNMVVKSDMLSIKQNAVLGMNQFAKAIDNGMSQSKASVSRGSTAMLSVLSNLQTGFYTSGYYASLGLANGINAGAGAAIAAANRLANQVAATMNNALKVGSPSRVTREIGGFTTEGFILGLLDDISNVKNAAAEIAIAAVPTGNIARSVAHTGNYMPDLSYEYTGDVSATYTIIVPLEIEGREIARATATYTQEELNKLESRSSRKRGYR